MKRAAFALLTLSWPTLALGADVFGGYSALRLDGDITNGGTVAVSWPLTLSLGLVVEGGFERGLVRGEDLDEWAVLAGSVFTPWPAKRFSPFVHAKAGVVRSRRQVEVFGVAIGPGGVCDGGCPFSTGPAAELGGGLDFRLANRISLRLAQVDYRMARLDDTNEDRLRVSTGVVYRWGR
jgi:hypothetical protein